MSTLRIPRGADWTLPCEVGGEVAGQPPHLYRHSPGVLPMTGTCQRTRRRLRRIPGVRPHQSGDREWCVLLPVSVLQAVAEMVHPKARPRRAR